MKILRQYCFDCDKTQKVVVSRVERSNIDGRYYG